MGHSTVPAVRFEWHRLTPIANQFDLVCILSVLFAFLFAENRQPIKIGLRSSKSVFVRNRTLVKRKTSPSVGSYLSFF